MQVCPFEGMLVSRAAPSVVNKLSLDDKNAIIIVYVGFRGDIYFQITRLITETLANSLIKWRMENGVENKDHGERTSKY